jgi:hypothetical protein
MGGPEPYLIWSILEERLIETRDFPEENIQIKMTEFKVSVS